MIKNTERSERSNIEKKVMRRVHTIHRLRPVVSLSMCSFVVGALALWGIGKEVWVARVFENMPRSSDLLSVGRFYFAAFSSTELLVQALVLATIVSCLYVVRGTVRTFSTLVTPAFS